MWLLNVNIKKFLIYISTIPNFIFIFELQVDSVEKASFVVNCLWVIYLPVMFAEVGVCS